MKKLWLDLELSGDIDDALVLIYALENGLEVGAVSLLNPTKEELGFTKRKMDEYSYSGALFVHFDKTIKNTNRTDKMILSESKYEGTRVEQSLSEITDRENYIVLGGGAYTIPNILRKEGFDEFVLQGGFAGANVVKNPIRKFVEKYEAASWNPNLDIKSTNEMITYVRKLTFISKDICHDSDVSIDDLTGNSDTIEFLKRYFGNSKKRKALHDLVALFYILEPDFIDLLKVEMIENQGKWHSKYQQFSWKKISIGWNKKRFLEILNRT